MKKRYVLGLFIIALISVFFILDQKIPPEKTLYLSTAFATTQEAHKASLRQKPIILWDLHDCLFEKPRFALMRKGLWNIENKPKFVHELLKATLNKNVRTQIAAQQDKYSYTPQAYFEALYNYDHLYTELNKLVNIIYEPNKSMFKIVKNLHDEDCKQYIFSNIGPITLGELEQDYPHYFAYFTDLKNIINPTTPAPNQWIQKPTKKAYQKALMAVDMSKHPQNIIFIDDRENNIQQAQNAGMNGIVYVSAKQVKEDLNRLIEV